MPTLAPPWPQAHHLKILTEPEVVARGMPSWPNRSCTVVGLQNNPLAYYVALTRSQVKGTHFAYTITLETANVKDTNYKK